MVNIEEFKNGIFALRTRRFGSVAEIMIEKLYGLNESHTLKYDKYDVEHDERIEVKFSTVMKENENTIRADNVIEQCIKANLANRAMTYCDIQHYKFDCNIQQIKCAEFEVLYYGLFCADKILIFKMTAQQVKACPGYSNQQHRNNVGEGQFHINNATLKHHYNYLIKELTYQELADLFNNSKSE